MKISSKVRGITLLYPDYFSSAIVNIFPYSLKVSGNFNPGPTFSQLENSQFDDQNSNLRKYFSIT